MKGSRPFLVVVLLMSFAWSAGSVASQGDAFSVSAAVLFCDVDPQSVAPAERGEVCGDAIGGTSIAVADEEGPIGACVTEPIETPNGGVSNGCGIDGAGFDSTLTFIVEEATLPAGYVLVENDLPVAVDDQIPGGGDQTTVTFMAIAEESGESTDQPTSRNEAIGFNADILTGSCDAPGQSVAILEAVVVETGAPVGATTGSGPETSISTVDVPLDTLIDEPHIVSIYGVNDHAGDRILCGDIGGVDNDDGTLFVVLAPVEPSIGAAGLAQLSYGADPASETDVRLFVVPAS